MLFQCWASIVDGGPAWNQHWLGTSNEKKSIYFCLRLYSKFISKCFIHVAQSLNFNESEFRTHLSHIINKSHIIICMWLISLITPPPPPPVSYIAAAMGQLSDLHTDGLAAVGPDSSITRVEPLCGAVSPRRLSGALIVRRTPQNGKVSA